MKAMTLMINLPSTKFWVSAFLVYGVYWLSFQSKESLVWQNLAFMCDADIGDKYGTGIGSPGRGV